MVIGDLEEKQKIVIVKDGQKVECEILFTFTSDDTGKAYIGYTDNTTSEDGKTNIYVSSYDPLNGYDKLYPVTDEKELEMVHDVIDEISRSEVEG